MVTFFTGPTGPLGAIQVPAFEYYTVRWISGINYEVVYYKDSVRYQVRTVVFVSRPSYDRWWLLVKRFYDDTKPAYSYYRWVDPGGWSRSTWNPPQQNVCRVGYQVRFFPEQVTLATIKRIDYVGGVLECEMPIPQLQELNVLRYVRIYTGGPLLFPTIYTALYQYYYNSYLYRNYFKQTFTLRCPITFVFPVVLPVVTPGLLIGDRVTWTAQPGNTVHTGTVLAIQGTGQYILIDDDASPTPVAVYYNLLTLIEPPSVWSYGNRFSTVQLSQDRVSASELSGAYMGAVRGINGRASGKLYMEFTCDWVGQSAYNAVGIVDQSNLMNNFIGSQMNSVGYPRVGWLYKNGTVSGPMVGGYTTGDVIQMAVDLSANKIWFGRNGAWALGGNPATGSGGTTITAGTYYPACSSVGGTWKANFGSDAFTYNAPANFTTWDGAPPISGG